MQKRLIQGKPFPSMQAPYSRKTSLPTFTFVVLSLSGIFLFYVTASTNPHRLDSVSDYYSSVTDERYKPRPTLTRSQADAFLTWDSVSQTKQAGGEIFRSDSVNIPSNPDGGEDRAMILTSSPSTELEDRIDFSMAGIFDGHVGSSTAEALAAYLPWYILRHLDKVSISVSFNSAASGAIDQAIKDAFTELDQDIMKKAELALESTNASAITALEAALAGSCAILSLYDWRWKMLKTACVGDSRAVLGRFSKTTGEWEAIALSKDQTGRNESEVSRLQREHPNEPEMIKDGRLLGLAVTRAFGDSRWKWARNLQELAREKFFGPQLRPELKTPPYLTAEPEITTVEIHPENGDFIIQASDGLWDELTSSQAVSLIGSWLRRYDPSKPAAPMVTLEGVGEVMRIPDSEEDSASGEETTYQDRVKEDDWVVKDENAASHLARNALGGGNYTRLRGMLTSNPPFARDMRDDITVQVIFFTQAHGTINNTSH